MRIYIYVCMYVYNMHILSCNAEMPWEYKNNLDLSASDTSGESFGRTVHPTTDRKN